MGSVNIFANKSLPWFRFPPFSCPRCEEGPSAPKYSTLFAMAVLAAEEGVEDLRQKAYHSPAF